MQARRVNAPVDARPGKRARVDRGVEEHHAANGSHGCGSKVPSSGLRAVGGDSEGGAARQFSRLFPTWPRARYHPDGERNGGCAVRRPARERERAESRPGAHSSPGGTAAPTAKLLAVTRAPCLDHAVSSMPRRCTYRLRQLAGLVVCGLVLQRCAAGTEPSAPAPAPECSVTAAELSRPYVRIEHRSAPIGCERTRPCTPIRPSICSSHAECTEGVNGRCGSGGEGCSYDECFGDEDCPAGAVCDCAGGRDNHRCLPGECITDDDCAEGLWCSPSTSLECPVGVVGFYCHTAADECVADGDCSDPSEFCAFDGARRAWVCTAQLCER